MLLALIYFSLMQSRIIPKKEANVTLLFFKFIYYLFIGLGVYIHIYNFRSRGEMEISLSIFAVISSC